MATRSGLFHWGRSSCMLLVPRYYTKFLLARADGGLSYTRLSVFAQALADITVMETYSQSLFDPISSVSLPYNDLDLLWIRPKENNGLTHPQGGTHLDYILRRMLTNSKRPLSETLTCLGPNGNTLLARAGLRDIYPRELTPEEYVKLTNAFSAWEYRPDLFDGDEK